MVLLDSRRSHPSEGDGGRADVDRGEADVDHRTELAGEPTSHDGDHAMDLDGVTRGAVTRA